MKLIAKILVMVCLLSLSNFVCKAQSFETRQHVYDTYSDKFIGTWLWSSQNNSFKLILKKEHADFEPTTKIKASLDVIIGFHQFIKEGKVIETSLNFATTSFNDNKSTLLGSTKNTNRNLLIGRMEYLSKNKSVEFVIEYIDSNHIKLVSVQNPEGIRISTPQNPYDSSISLPQNIILIRQQ